MFPAIAAAQAIPPDKVETVHDTVETIPDTVEAIEKPSDRSPAPAPAASVQADNVRIEAGGWARQRFEYFPMERPVAAGRNDFISRTDLLVRVRYARTRQFEVNASSQLTHGLFHGNIQGETGTRGAFEPTVREAFFGLYGSQIDVRVGQQRLAWGVTDFMSPNDVVNARDQRDPFLIEPELRFIPTPMVRLDWYRDILTLQAVYSPWFVPDRFDIYGTNWAAIQPSSPPGFRNIAAGTLERYDRSLFDPAQRLYQQTSLPRADFRYPSAGVQAAINGSGFDLHFYYHYGFDGPHVAVDPSNTTLSASYLRRHHVGMDAATTLGPIVLRAEVAFQDHRSFFRSDLLSHKSPAGQAVGAIEWQTGDSAKVALLEVFYQHLFEHSPVPLLAWKRDSYGAGLLVKWPLWGRLRTDSRILAGVQPLMAVARLGLELDFDRWVVGAGWLLVTGSEPSFGWYYRNNDEALAFVKWLF